jgi:glycerol-3-phosphate dehydrogenase
VREGSNGVITVNGGKLTTYRHMAEETVDLVVERLGRSDKCRTKRLAIHGRQRDRELAALIADDSSLGLPLVDGLPYTRAEAVYAVTQEMATTLDDVLSRRTRALLFDREGARRAARPTAELVAPLLGWDATRVDLEVESFDRICRREVESYA